MQSETERKLSAESQEPAIRAAPESAAGRPSWRPGWFPVTVSLIYALMGALWILVSDRLALELAPDIETFHLLQSYKGWLYIGITALLLFMVLAGAERHIRKERAAREDTLQRLDFALRAAQGGIWERNLGTGEFFISHHIKRLLGIHSEEALSLSAWRERIHPDDRTHARARMRDFYRHREREISLSYRVRREDGHYCWFQIVGRRVGGKRGEPKSGRVIGVMLDVTALRHAEADIERLIHYDALTGLPNRSMFHAELVHALAASSDSAGLLVARCDLDAFGDVNTELGPDAGDATLAKLAARLRSFAGARGFCGRIGGDEFALALPLEPDAPHAFRSLADRLKPLFEKPLRLDRGDEVDLTASIGIAVFPQDGDTAETLMANAAVAVGEARKEGKAALRFYAAGMNEAVRTRKSLGRELRHALQAESLETHYQPIVTLPERQIVGFEALARWTHPSRGPIPPANFIPIAEEQGLIGEVGRFIMRQACREARAWKEATGRDLQISVNLSPVDLTDPELDDVIEQILGESELEPSMLELEVTEGAVMSNFELAARTLERLRALGISIAIDDFGTGYSSLVALRRLPVSRLKIDRSFVDGYGTEAEDTAIVNSVIELAHALELGLTAEGVETEAQCALLAEHSCEHAQGYLFAPPVPPTRAWHLLAGGRSPTRRRPSAQSNRRRGAQSN